MIGENRARIQGLERFVDDSYDYRDSYYDLNPAALGEDLAKDIKVWLEENGRQLPQGATYLAMGAGQAIPEFALARSLGISDQNLTLLDKKFSSATLMHFKREHPAVQIIEENAFRFLSRDQKGKYSAISAISMEYAFRKGSMPGFIEALSFIVSPGSFAAVHPYFGNEDMNLWQQNGFEPLFSSPNILRPPTYHMVFQGKGRS